MGQIQKSGLGAGASGMFFFMANDKRFIMKTMTPTDLKEMIFSLHQFYMHYDQNPNSLLARIFGCFTIQMDKFSPVHVMIMENVIPPVPGYDLNHVFDMKGSEFSREVLKKKQMEMLRNEKATGGLVLKDLDFVRLKQLRKFISLTDEDWRALTDRIMSDT